MLDINFLNHLTDLVRQHGVGSPEVDLAMAGLQCENTREVALFIIESGRLSEKVYLYRPRRLQRVISYAVFVLIFLLNILACVFKWRLW